MRYMFLFQHLVLVILAFFAGQVAAGDPVATAPDSSPSSEILFERDVRPVLREYCLDCHGASETKEGGLDLRLVRFMVTGGDSGTAILAGNANESLFLQRIVAGEMPPGEHKVPAGKVELLRKWIEGGAKTARVEPEHIGPGVPITEEDRDYWAFRPIVRPEVKVVSNEQRIRTGIDALLAEAMPQGLRFSPDAERGVLIRRLYFDLIGLPPTTEELARWMNTQAEDWYDQLIESLLDSPHYGERWGRHWLDVAGYAESEGQTVQDADRPWAWKYRDYVIRAFNNNKPSIDSLSSS